MPARAKIRHSCSSKPPSNPAALPENPPPAPPESGASPVECAARKVVNAAPEIVEAVILKAKTGSYLHAKFLFDFARLSPPEAAASEDSLARLLLDELRGQQIMAPLE